MKRIRTPEFYGSVALQLALGYGVLVASAFIVVSTIFYFGTIGVLENGIDAKIVSISDRLIDSFGEKPPSALCAEIQRQLTDGIDSDTEIFLVLSPTGHPLAGNLSMWPDASTPQGQLVQRRVVRGGKSTEARLLIRPLPQGGLLLIGRDLQEQESIRGLIWRALTIGAAVSLGFMVIGALFFRQQIEARIGHIRRIAHDIAAGDLSRRIPISGSDEFGLLNQDINLMLDRIEQLMNGVRHVSNAIAHDLRTPLSRIRGKLDDAVRHEKTVASLSDAAHAAIDDIDGLILLFEKLLQIAEAESGVRIKSFATVPLWRIVHDMVDLYASTAEDRDITLLAKADETALASGDRNLLASAVANLIDNAIKYSVPGACITVGAALDAQSVCIVVRDNGPGIPDEELSKVTERFYRLDRSRHQPGNGLGLAIVQAIATLHGGQLVLENTAPGLCARIILPRVNTPATETSAEQHTRF